jgi:hypothetical protein
MYQVNVSQLQMVIAGYKLHNYEHVITQQLCQLWKVRSGGSLLAHDSSVLCRESCVCGYLFFI